MKRNYEVERTEDDLRAFVEEQRNVTLRYLVGERDESFCPKFCAKVLDWDSGDEEDISGAIITNAGIGNIGDERDVMVGLGAMFYQQKKIPLLFCLITQAWRGAGPNAEPKDPKEDPNTDEVLAFCGSTFAMQKNVLGFIETDRHPDGYLMPGPKSELYVESESPLLEAFWVGMSRAAKADMKRNGG